MEIVTLVSCSNRTFMELKLKNDMMTDTPNTF